MKSLTKKIPVEEEVYNGVHCALFQKALLEFSHTYSMSLRVVSILCMGCILLCLYIIPVFAEDELILINSSSSIGNDLISTSEEGSVLAMIQQLKEIAPETESLEDLEHVVQNSDATSIIFDENGNYIPQFPARGFAKGIFTAGFSATGVERYPNGTVISSYAISDSTTVAGLVTQFVKQYRYVSGVDLCASGEC